MMNLRQAWSGIGLLNGPRPCIAACLLTAFTIATAGPDLPEARAFGLDSPSRLDIGPDGVANVIMVSDTNSGVISRVSRDGALLTRLSSHPSVVDVAASPDGKLFVAGYRTSELWIHDEDGPSRQSTQWTGEIRAVAVEPQHPSGRPMLLALTRQQALEGPGPTRMVVQRISADGSLVGEWGVPDASTDLYAGAALGEVDPGVTIVAGTDLIRYGRDGEALARATLPEDATRLSGSGNGQLYVASRTADGSSGRLWVVEPSGQSNPVCDLPGGSISDLAIDRPRNEILVVAGSQVWRLESSCRPIARYSRELLGGIPTPSATAVGPPIPTPTDPSHGAARSIYLPRAQR